MKDARAAAQVDETRARILLSQERIKEAERVICSAVRVHEKDGNTVLLTEALITYGRVLAQSKNYAASLGTFRRAIELADNAGLSNRATEAIVAAFRELSDHLVISGTSTELTQHYLQQIQRDVRKRVTLGTSSVVLELSPMGILPAAIADDEAGVGVGVGCAIPV